MDINSIDGFWKQGDHQYQKEDCKVDSNQLNNRHSYQIQLFMQAQQQTFLLQGQLNNADYLTPQP